MIGDYVPRIHAKLRRKFPIVNESVIQEVLLLSGAPSPAPYRRWEMVSRDKNRSVVLTSNFVVFQTSAYTVFEEFLADLAEAVDVVATEVEAVQIERVGLRYIDLVRPSDRRSWRDYVRPGLHGFESSILKPHTQSQLFQSVAETDRGTLVVRLFQNREAKILPPDLVNGGLIRNVDPAPQPGELLTLLDLDHYSTPNIEYERGCVEREGWALHDGLDHVFRESLVTPAALETWK